MSTRPGEETVGTCRIVFLTRQEASRWLPEVDLYRVVTRETKGKGIHLWGPNTLASCRRYAELAGEAEAAARRLSDWMQANGSINPLAEEAWL